MGHENTNMYNTKLPNLSKIPFLWWIQTCKPRVVMPCAVTDIKCHLWETEEEAKAKEGATLREITS